MVEIKVGETFEKEITVKESMLASSVGSGFVSVYATPMMIALMEEVSSKCLQQFLDMDMTSVGTEISVSHLSPTPRGMKVTASATITAVNGRMVTFAVKAKDEIGLIGEGTHQRVIVNAEKFNEKANKKKL
ncbi:MAG: thioesterase family protein [Oscillospiraceae bacterium]